MAARKARVGAKGKSSKKKSSKSSKVVVKKAASKRLPSVSDPLTKGGIIRSLTDMTDLPKKDITAVLDGLSTLIELHVKSRGPGKFIMPGLLKITVIKKAATPARKGINPFTGEPAVFKAKPARRVVKIRALSKLKEMAV
ncbi:MAG: HU family DNA-binding protein [Gammaproteobacteria bacterium]|nr:HU family DNA-binding protein [Gammaproteobacteria bacterium]